ncbi:hypothetical protein IQ265_28225 [Nodosilinea sp. LEGE 06152]|nr:hypothetical protein [Nodosilinea sp. LEGE 06152]
MAPVADRAYALLEWVESSVGCGLKRVKNVLTALKKISMSHFAMIVAEQSH